MKTRFKRAQVIYNKHIFDRLNEQEHEFDEQCIFRAHEEALIKQRVTKLENQMPYLKDYDIALRVTKLEEHAILKNQGEINGDVIKRLKSAEIWIQDLGKECQRLDSAHTTLIRLLPLRVREIMNVPTTVNFMDDIDRRMAALEKWEIQSRELGAVHCKHLNELDSATVKGNSTRFVAVEQDVQHLNSRLRKAEATIVSLENKLDTLQKGLCKLEVEKHVLKSCDEKRKRGRPKKV